jgi:hypothetical protein
VAEWREICEQTRMRLRLRAVNCRVPVHPRLGSCQDGGTCLRQTPTKQRVPRARTEDVRCNYLDEALLTNTLPMRNDTLRPRLPVPDQNCEPSRMIEDFPARSRHRPGDDRPDSSSGNRLSPSLSRSLCWRRQIDPPDAFQPDRRLDIGPVLTIPVRRSSRPSSQSAGLAKVETRSVPSANLLKSLAGATGLVRPPA